MVKVLSALLDDAGNGQDATGHDAEIKAALGELAGRIAENRVVAGLHFSDDNTQGKELGEKLADYFIDRSVAQRSALRWLWRKAAGEVWK